MGDSVTILHIDTDLPKPVLAKIKKGKSNSYSLVAYTIDGRAHFTGGTSSDDLVEDIFKAGNIIANNMRSLLVMGDGSTEDVFSAIVIASVVNDTIGQSKNWSREPLGENKYKKQKLVRCED